MAPLAATMKFLPVVHVPNFIRNGRLPVMPLADVVLPGPYWALACCLLGLWVASSRPSFDDFKIFYSLFATSKGSSAVLCLPSSAFYPSLQSCWLPVLLRRSKKIVEGTICEISLAAIHGKAIFHHKNRRGTPRRSGATCENTKILPIQVPSSKSGKPALVCKNHHLGSNIVHRFDIDNRNPNISRLSRELSKAN